ncbi:putative ATP diphosphatase [Helianthus debilis subsp. tardiflorus]
MDGVNELDENDKISNLLDPDVENIPLDESRKTGQTSGTKMVFCSTLFLGSFMCSANIRYRIQLAINVQIPYEYGGVGGKAIYIDTEGSFMVERALQIAEACSADMAEYSRFHHKGPQACEVKTMQPKDFLENIFYFRVCSYTEQIALTNYLDKFITEHKDVKVVIIDSITFHFRQDFDDMALRTRILSGMALNLMKLARKFGLAVVVLNQVTTKYADGQFHLALALGNLYMLIFCFLFFNFAQLHIIVTWWLKFRVNYKFCPLCLSQISGAVLYF